MKTTISLRLLLLAVLSFFFSLVLSAQTEHAKLLPLTGKALYATAGCDGDVTAPAVHCPVGNCLPTARAAYLISNSGEPWNSSNNIDAMNAVFGFGNWERYTMDNVDPATVISPAYKVIFLEGSDQGASALVAFLQANLPALENWVAAGSALFINCASNYRPETTQFGFGGVTLQSYVGAYNVEVQVPGHPIFNLPFTPANGDFTGNSFFWGTISGPAGLTLLTSTSGPEVGLTEKKWGTGKVFFGSMTPPMYHNPQLNAQNMRQNILANLNAVCNNQVFLPADAGACTATVAAQALDATATDDCAVVSLTHDFAAAPSATTLSGAVFPTGSTLVRWSATDAAGNTGTCEFLLSVREPEAAVITCPVDMALTADVGACGAVANFTVTATDNCTPDPTIVATPAAGSLFANGTTTVQAVATDVSGNISTCSFVVTVAGNPELCNGLDDDCNGLVDDGAPADNNFYLDADGDGYGDLNHPLAACFAPSGYAANALDCNDADYYIQPGMSEYCDGIDNNCDGSIDEGVTPTWYADTDGDGYGDPNVTKLACNQPTGYTYDNNDCDDTNAYIHPGAQEDCTNFTDENCDGILGNNAFTIAETHTNVFCGSTPDGTISITMSPAQNYTLVLWSNGVCCTTTQTNLQAGTYKVTVTNECGTTKVKTIVIAPSATPTLEVTMTGKQVDCRGDGDGTVTATPRQGCPGYTYLWNTGSTDASLSGLSGGTYSVVVTDGCGCTQTGTFTVTEPASPLYLDFGAIVALLDGNYWVQVLPYGGTPPYKFRRNILPTGFTAWSNSNGFGDLAPGEYIFEVEDKNGCSAQVPISLQPFTPAPLPAGNHPAVAAVDGAVSEIAVEKPEISGSGALQSSIATMPLAKQELDISIFPNPTEGELNIVWSGFEGQSATIQIINNMGQVIRTLPVPADALRVMTNVGELPGGFYFVKIFSADKQIKALPFVKS